ncbi:MAG: GNAT family N-acetyltransferase [Fimbriimonadaceae bacterium]|nr:GNAT family N-acetyltransferase [Fimbriimonadaceae bacterium]QYK59136.1 MAG: GNAT family N-acetyltransferase [Fimbriimonadaceae bacterium]
MKETPKPSTIELPAPQLCGSRISLVPPEREYWEQIRAWESDPEEMHLWTHRQSLPTREQFAESFVSRLQSGYFDAYCVILDTAEAPKGFVYTYQSQNDMAYLTAYADRSARGSGLIISALLRFMHWRFSITSPLTRLRADTFSYNQASEANLVKAGFEQVGEIKRHRRYLGVDHDLKVWELARSSFYEMHLRLLQRELRL